MKKILLTLLFMLVAQVTVFAFGVDSTMTTVINSWIGQNINSVIDRWGYPNETREFDGHKLYVWKTERTVTSSEHTETKPHTDKKGRTYYTTTTTGGETTVYTTERILEVDENGNVVRGKYSGNDLPFTFMGVAKDWLNPNYPMPR